MMGFARYAMKSRFNAGVLAAGLAVLPMLYALSAALVGLVALRHGSTAGTRVLLAALAGALVSWQLTGVILPLLVLPMTAILALVLRRSQDWSVMLLSATVLGLCLATVGQQLMPDRFTAIVGQIQAMMTPDPQQMGWQVLEAIKPYATFLVMSAEVFEALLCVLLARYWQAGLYNPGGLRAELHRLRISGRPLWLLTGAIIVSWWLQPAALLLLLLPLVFAGVALVHALVARLKLGGQWLVAFYLATFLVNQFMLPLLVLVAVADGAVDIRARLPQQPDQDDK
ncbi:hypothetical protein BGP77_02145 [Saccharospirillum sp. MSK14-1]|uniref:hypothetical protein n=1 Tax=Saccharospirillum sp. MSK14-1 TaxID=1897632 RepID=UPI000D3964FD|nr:hypothetical protein [Saccharospirillum sp. MSK14-1]PTY36137.1 hypothetical protein BGP77_02145 [Saccharospirillum sp. MSK14-1]